MAKKKHFGFLIFLFILYNNFIINYKTVHTLAQLTNTLTSTNTKQSTHNKVFLHVVQKQHNSQILQQAHIQKSLHVRNSVQEVGRGYIICFVLGSGILKTLLQHCVTAICVPVQVFSSHTCVYQLRLSSQLTLGINLYIPTPFNSFETHCH